MGNANFRCDRAPSDEAPPMVWPSDAWFDRFNARNRAALGLPALPDVSDLPADVRGFLERM